MSFCRNLKELIKQIKLNQSAYLFILFVLIQLAVLLISVFFTIEIIQRYYFIELPTDTFGDFGNVLTIMHNYENPYNTGFAEIDSSYPPFALLFYLPYKLFYYLPLTFDKTPLILGFLCYISIPIVVIIKLYIKNIKIHGKVIFIICLFLSFPFLYLILRGNVLIYSYMFVLIFLTYYNSENKKKREFALIALAAASVIKLYPLVFLMLLLKSGRLGDILKTIFYFLILFFVPFIFFKGGFSNLHYFISNMGNFLGTMQDFTKIRTDNYGLNTLLQFISAIFNNNLENTVFISRIISAVLVCFVIIFSLIIKSEWKIFALLAIVITFVPAISFIYTQVFFIIAFIEFIQSGKKTKKDYIYLSLFLIILMPFNRIIFSDNFPSMQLPINLPWYYNNPDIWFSDTWKPLDSPLNTFIAVFSIFIMFMIISFDAIKEFFGNVNQYGYKNTLKSILMKIIKKN